MDIKFQILVHKLYSIMNPVHLTLNTKLYAPHPRSP